MSLIRFPCDVYPIELLRRNSTLSPLSLKKARRNSTLASSRRFSLQRCTCTRMCSTLFSPPLRIHVRTHVLVHRRRAPSFFNIVHAHIMSMLAAASFVKVHRRTHAHVCTTTVSLSSIDRPPDPLLQLRMQRPSSSFVFSPSLRPQISSIKLQAVLYLATGSGTSTNTVFLLQGYGCYVSMFLTVLCRR